MRKTCAAWVRSLRAGQFRLSGRLPSHFLSGNSSARSSVGLSSRPTTPRSFVSIYTARSSRSRRLPVCLRPKAGVLWCAKNPPRTSLPMLDTVARSARPCAECRRVRLGLPYQEKIAHYGPQLKHKCDRRLPCTACVTRGQVSSRS
jgi:hypothetical protein